MAKSKLVKRIEAHDRLLEQWGEPQLDKIDDLLKRAIDEELANERVNAKHLHMQFNEKWQAMAVNNATGRIKRKEQAWRQIVAIRAKI